MDIYIYIFHQPLQSALCKLALGATGFIEIVNSRAQLATCGENSIMRKGLVHGPLLTLRYALSELGGNTLLAPSLCKHAQQLAGALRRSTSKSGCLLPVDRIVSLSEAHSFAGCVCGDVYL